MDGTDDGEITTIKGEDVGDVQSLGND